MSKRLEELTQEVARKNGKDPLILRFLRGHNMWIPAEEQVPTFVVLIDNGRPVRVYERAEVNKTLCSVGLAYVTSKLGKHRGPTAINPLSGRKLSTFTFMTERAVDDYGSCIFQLYEQFTSAETMGRMSEQEFIDKLREKVRSRLALYTGFVGERVTVRGVRGILLRETDTSLWVSSKDGVPVKLKKSPPPRPRAYKNEGRQYGRR